MLSISISHCMIYHHKLSSAVPCKTSLKTICIGNKGFSRLLYLSSVWVFQTVSSSLLVTTDLATRWHSPCCVCNCVSGSVSTSCIFLQAMSSLAPSGLGAATGLPFIRASQGARGARVGFAGDSLQNLQVALPAVRTVDGTVKLSWWCSELT